MPSVVTIHPLLRPFQSSDAEALANRDGRQCSTRNMLEQAAGGPAFTATVEGRPIAAAGVVLSWPGMGMAWMIVGEEAVDYMKWLTETVRRFLDDIIDRECLHRMEAVALEESERNQRWLEHMGFRREVDGVAQAYLTDRRNMIRYERIQEDVWRQPQ